MSLSKVVALISAGHVAQSSRVEATSLLSVQSREVGRWFFGDSEAFAKADTKNLGSDLFYSSFDVDGLVCAGPQSAFVIRPNDDKAYPLVSFAHGFGSGGEKMKDFYSIIMSSIASAGFVVVAPESGDGTTAREQGCREQWQDQLKVLEWAKTAEGVKDFVAPGRAVLVGQSMGATATLLAASEADPEQIAGAVAIHPHKYADKQFDYSKVSPKVPTLTLTGDVDVGNKDDAYELFDLAKSSNDQQIIEVEGAMHCDSCDGNKNLEHPYVLEFLKCHLTDKAVCSDIASATVSGVSVVAHKE